MEVFLPTISSTNEKCCANCFRLQNGGDGDRYCAFRAKRLGIYGINNIEERVEYSETFVFNQWEEPDRGHSIVCCKFSDYEGVELVSTNINAFKPGDQIVYIPTHADGDLLHKDCEKGFVTSIVPRTNTVRCRYWSKFHEGLRTIANSEGCDPSLLVKSVTRPQSHVDNLLKAIKENPERYGEK